jgi:hypothetical protein
MQISPSVQMRLEETQRRNQVVPVQFKDIAQSALAGAQTVEQLQGDRQKREKAAQFQKVIEEGLPAMQRVHQELGDPNLPDPTLFTDSRESVVSWYQLANEKATQKKGTQAIEQGGSYDELGRNLVKSGALSPKDYYANARPGRGGIQAAALPDDIKQALEKGMDAIEAQEQEDGAVLADSQRQAILRANGIPAAMLANKAVEAIWKTGVAGESKEGLRKTAQSEKDRREGLDLKRQELMQSRVIKLEEKTDELFEELKLFDQLDTAIPGGIDGEGSVDGFGFGTKPLRKFWKTEEAVKVKVPLQGLINRILKRRSGAAVSEQEFDRLENEFGINTSGTVEEFRLGLKTYRDLAEAAYERKLKADPGAAAVLEAPAPAGTPKAPRKAKAGKPAAPKAIGRFQVEVEED